MKVSATLTICLALLLASVVKLHAIGALYIRPLNSQQSYSLMSIKTFDATVSIQDQIAVTHIDQKFFNKSTSRVESTFIFPLPEGAVITELFYWFNGKRYVASLREKQEAQKAYNDKIRQLIDPALLQSIGDNVFKLNIAPIEPSSEVRFEITYAELLPYEFGEVDYRFLLNTTGLSPDPLDRVSVTVDATTSKTFKSFTCPSHGGTPALGINPESPSHYRITFGDEQFIPDRDLRLTYETRRSGVDMTVQTYVPTPADSFGVESFYALWITPPDSATETDLPSRNIVFTADVSSSMEGKRVAQLKEALGYFLNDLTERDRFNIVLFSTDAVVFQPNLVDATPQAVADARAFVNSIGAVGLTNIDGALNRSLAMDFDTTRSNILIFMTDGYPTWGQMKISEILDSATARNAGRARIFPFGIGEDISTALLNDLGARNGGYTTFIRSDDSIAAVIANYFRRVSLPALSGLKLDYGGLSSSEQYDRQLSDLFWGGQILQFGRYVGGGEHTLTLTGTRAATPFALSTTAQFGTELGGNRAVARLWAKRKIDVLLAQIKTTGEQKELVDAVIDLSIRFGILTPYTAFYVDPTDPDTPTTTDAPNDLLAPLKLTLFANYPNPFVGSTTIRFALPATQATARLAVYDVAGRLVKVLAQGTLSAGLHEIRWDGTDDAGNPAPAGTYLCRLEQGDQQVTQTIIMQR